MNPVSANSPPQPRTPGFFLPSESLAAGACGTLARLFAYVGALVLIGILVIAAWHRFGGLGDAEPRGAGWAIADGAVPAYALRLTDQPDKFTTYTVLRHPDGGRKDVIRWGEA